MLETKDAMISREDETLRGIISSIGEGVVIAEIGGEFVFLNPAAREILGLNQDALHQSDWLDVHGCHDPDTLEPISSRSLPLARALRGERVDDELLFIKKPNWAEGKFVEVSARPIENGGGEITGGTVTFRDVTQRIRWEKAKTQSELRVKAQFDGIPIPTYVWQQIDGDFKLVDFNRAAEVFTEGTIAGLLGTKCRELYAGSPLIEDDFLRCFELKTSIRREMPYRMHHSGEVKDLVITYVFVPPDLVMVHTEDISERRRASAELSKLSNAVEQTAESVVITNRSGIIEYVNPAFEETTGYKREEVLGRRPDILKSGVHDKAFYAHLWKTILDYKPYRGTIVNKKKNGELYWSEQTITPMKDDQGNITHFVSVLKDITELRHQREQEFFLQVAQEVQEHLYQANFAVPGLDIYGSAHSATATCGDYFDVIHTPEGSVLLVVGDVCGHGIGSALIMGTTRAYLRAFSRFDSDPGRILTRLNRELCSDLDAKHFVTLIMVRLDPIRETMEYASAGHVPGFLLDSATDGVHWMERMGVPLGILPNQEYMSSTASDVHAGDILVLLTDGVSEARASDGSEWGVEGALELVKQNRDSDAREIVDRIWRGARRNAKNRQQEDDITALVCKIMES